MSYIHDDDVILRRSANRWYQKSHHKNPSRFFKRKVEFRNSYFNGRSFVGAFFHSFFTNKRDW